MSQIEARNPSAIWCFPAAGTESIRFIRAYSQFGLKAKAPLIGLDNLVDPQSITDSIGEAGVGVRTAAFWVKSLKNEENKRFLAAYKTGSGYGQQLRAPLGIFKDPGK